MALSSCPCCNRPRPVGALLRRRALHWDGAWRFDTARLAGRHPLCTPCQVWLAGILGEVRETTDGPRMYGAPSTNDRLQLFDDQCNICFTIPKERAAWIDCIAVASDQRSWPGMFVCEPCDAWIASVANDGQSARGAAQRVIDGPYGEWPHPNLRELSVEVEVPGKSPRATIFESCLAMGVPVRAGFQAESDAVLFVEATANSDITAMVRAARASGRVVMVLAAMDAREALVPALNAGAAGWLTVPVTPQQVTAALSGVLRRGLRRAWDPETCLPIASLVDVARPALVFEPAGVARRFELAWLLKRLSRGYDELAVAGGHIVLLPKAPPERLNVVRARLEGLLAGRCRVIAMERHTERTARFDAAG